MHFSTKITRPLPATNEAMPRCYGKGKKEKKITLRFSVLPKHSFAMSRFPSLPEARRAQFLAVIRGRVRAGCSCGGTAACVGKLFPGRKQAALPAPRFYPWAHPIAGSLPFRGTTLLQKAPICIRTMPGRREPGPRAKPY